MASTIIHDEMRELKLVETELKEINLKAKQLRLRQKELRLSIQEWLIETDRPGCMYDDLIVLLKESRTRARMKKKEKEQAAITALEERGIQNPEEVYKIMIQATTGEERTQSSLKIKLAGREKTD